MGKDIGPQKLVQIVFVLQMDKINYKLIQKHTTLINLWFWMLNKNSLLSIFWNTFMIYKLYNIKKCSIIVIRSFVMVVRWFNTHVVNDLSLCILVP